MQPNRLYARTLISVAAVLLSASASLAADNEASTNKWSGYLVDQSCRASIEGDENPLPFVKAQTRECALLPSCRKAGYSIYTKGKWLNLDANGNKLAEKLLTSTKRTKSFYVLAEGSLNGYTIKVTHLSEQDEPQKQDSKSK